MHSQSKGITTFITQLGKGLREPVMSFINTNIINVCPLDVLKLLLYKQPQIIQGGIQ